MSNEESKLTVDVLQKTVPKSRRGMITPEFVKKVNDIVMDDEVRDAFRDNLIGYSSILKENRHTLKQYVRAIRYCTYKMADCTNIEAFVKSSPEKYQDMVNKNYDERNISSNITIFSKSKLVTGIMDMATIPTHLINADLHQKAINHLAYLMINARSEKVQSDSAAKLVDTLKLPETAKIELDIKGGQDSAIDDLRQSTLELVKQQKMMIEAGVSSAKMIAHSKIIDSTAEIIEVE